MNWIQHIRNAPKQTPVKLWLRLREPVDFPDCRVFSGCDGCCVVLGEWSVLQLVLQAHAEAIDWQYLECDRRNAALPLLELQQLQARVEPGALIREGARLGRNAVIMMGAIVNVGAQVGENTMVDMGAVLGGRAVVGRDCHIGAGAVLAGVIEPPSAVPVVVGDGVLIGANAVILEGCRVGDRAVVAAGAVVTRDVPENAVVAGCPARFLKYRDAKTDEKTRLSADLREL